MKTKSAEVKNIFNGLSLSLSEEYFETLIEEKNFKLERIVSQGNQSPKDFWYDQDKNEFVFLISGAATLRYHDDTILNLKPGDYIIIPAHKKHRVDWTDPDQKTFWLALFF